MMLILAAIAAAAAPPAPPQSAPGGYVATLDPCEAAVFSDPDAADVLAWRTARDTNRMDDYRRFLSLYPASVCAAEAKQQIATREKGAAKWAAEYAAEPATGPRPAELLGDPAGGITNEDYPPLAMRNGEEGTVAVRFEIAPDGQIESCRVTQSSGSAILDRTTCHLFTTRMRFRPARDAAGKPVRSTSARRITWRIPRDAPAPQSRDGQAPNER